MLPPPLSSKEPSLVCVFWCAGAAQRLGGLQASSALPPSWVPPAPALQGGLALSREGLRMPENRREARSFPHYDHSAWNGRMAYLRLSQTYGCGWQDLKAVCTRHPQCGRSRSCRSNRPLGELWAWLNFMSHPSCISKAVHASFQPDFDTRARARAHFKSLPGVSEYIAAEATMEGVDEPP